MALVLLLPVFIFFAATITAVPVVKHTLQPSMNQTIAKYGRGNFTIGTQSSDVLFGSFIANCVIPGTIALTFDDGPSLYTPDLLQILSEYGARSTFFVNGENIYDRLGTIQRILDEGHQLGSHTWGHYDLTDLDYWSIRQQMLELEWAFINIINAFPMYMRPPFLSIDHVVSDVMNDLGYHVIGASIDTKDYAYDDPALIGISFDKFRNELSAGGSIVLAHDVHEQTVYTLVREMLDEIAARGLNPVTVGECLGDPESDWYRAYR